MVTKRTRLMSAIAAILMLVSMFTAFVLPASAAAYSKDVNEYPNFPKTSEIGTYTVAEGYLHFLIEDLDDLNYVAQNDAAFSAGTTLHLAKDITITGPQAPANKITNLYANIDGHGYTIRGGHFDRDAVSGGWIAQTKTAGQVIKNLTLDGWYAKEVGWQGGLLVYNVEKDLTLENITVRNSTVTKTAQNGGSALVGVINTDNVTLTMRNITMAGNTLVYNSDNAGLLIGRVAKSTAKVDMDGIYIFNNTMTGGAGNATGLLWGEYDGSDGTTVKNMVAMGNTYSAIKASLGRVKSGSVTFSNIVVKDTGATPVNMVRLCREDSSATVTLGENIFTNATTLVQDDGSLKNAVYSEVYTPATEAQTVANANVCDFSDMNAITTALGAGWGLSKVYTDAEGNGYPIQTAHEGEDPNLSLAKEVVGIYGLYKEGYKVDFDIWSDASATKMRNAYNAAAAVVAALTADPAADVAADMAIIKDNYTAFADANGALLTLKNEYPYYPKLTDADLYTDLLAKYDIAHAIDWTARSGSTGWARAKDYRLDGDGHLNFRISTAEEWIELTNNSTFVSGYYAFPQRANDAMIQINGIDGNHTVVFHVTDDIDFAAYDTIKPLRAGGGNFIFNGHNHSFKNVDISVDVSTASGTFTGTSNATFTSVDGNNTTTKNMIGVSLIWFPSNNIFYMNFGVASGNINVTGSTNLPVYVAPCVAYGNGNFGGAYGCWNGANVNVSATSTYNVIVSGIANFNRQTANIANCLNLGTITKTSGDQKTYLAYHDVLGGGYDTNFLYNTKGVYGSVTDAANDTLLDANSGIAAQGVSVAELAYNVNKNFTKDPCIYNGNTTVDKTKLTYAGFIVNPNFKLDNSVVAYGTAADCVRKVMKQNCDSLGNAKEGEDPVLVGYYNGNATVEVPAADSGYTFSAEKSGVTLNGNSFTMAGADVTLKYVDDSVDLAVVEEIYNEWSQYDQKLFDAASAAAIKDVVDTADALLDKGSATSNEVTTLQNKVAALNPKLNYTYPTYVPFSQWQLYEKFGLEDASDNNHVKFAIGSAEEAKYVMDNYAMSSFLTAAKTNDGSKTLTAAYGGTADAASKSGGDGSYRVEFHMTADIDLTPYTGESKLAKGFNMQQTMFYGHKHVFKNIEIDFGTGNGGFFGSGNNCVIMDVGLANGTIKGNTVASFRYDATGWTNYIINSWSALDLTGTTAAYGFSQGIMQMRSMIENSAFVGTLSAPTVALTSGRDIGGGANGKDYNGTPAHTSTFYTDDYVWAYPTGTNVINMPGTTVSDDALETGELAYLMSKAEFHTGYRADYYTWDTPTKAYYTLDANGNMVYGTEANSVRKVTIQLKDAIGQLENTFVEYKNGDAANVALNTYEGYAISAADCTNVTLGDGTYTMQGKDATLIFKSTKIGPAGAQAIYDEWKVYDLDLFDATSKAAIEAVLTTAEDIIKVGSTTQEALDALVAAEAALDPELKNAYPNVVPLTQYKLYEKFGLHNADNVILLGLTTPEDVVFATENFNLLQYAHADSFWNNVTDGEGTLYRVKYSNNTGNLTTDTDTASKHNGDGKYRLRLVLTNDISMAGYTLTSYINLSNNALLGYNHVISDIDVQTTDYAYFLNGHNTYIADVGLQGSIKGAGVVAPVGGLGGGNGHMRNCWFDMDLESTGGDCYAVAYGINEGADKRVVNIASFGTGADYVICSKNANATAYNFTGIYYPASIAKFNSNSTTQPSGAAAIAMEADAITTGALAYTLNKADYSSANSAMGTYHYGANYATDLKTYYDVVDGEFAFSAANPNLCKIELLNTAGDKVLYVKKDETIELKYDEEIPCTYEKFEGDSVLTENSLLVKGDTKITVTLEGLSTVALEAAVAKYNGLNAGYYVNKTSGENDLAAKIAEANAIINKTNTEVDQDTVNALATLISTGYELDSYPNIPKVGELATYKDLGARDFLVADITDLNALAAAKASFTKDYTVHFAENVVIEVGAEDAANNMSGMNANINGHGATIKGVTFSLTAADGTAAWLGVYGGSKISNLVLDSWNTTFTGWKSGVLIANSSVALTLENITIKDCTASFTGNYGGFLLADYNGSALTLTNITVEGSTMNHAAGNDGLLVGRVNTGTLTATGIYAKNNIVNHNNSNVGSGNGLIFGEICVNSTISNVIAVGNTMTLAREQAKAGGIVGNIKNGAITLSNAIIEDTGTGIVFRQWTDNNAHAPSFTINNVYTDAAMLVSYSTVDNNVTGTDRNGATATAAQMANGYVTNALNEAGDDIWTMVKNGETYAPAFVEEGDKATVAVSFTSDSWLAGDGGLTYTYYTDSTGKLIGVAEADVVALKKVDNWDDLDAAVLASYDVATTISGTYEGAEHTHIYGNLVPNVGGTHSGECTEADCPWYDNALPCTYTQYTHNGDETYAGSAHTASCACGNVQGEAVSCSNTKLPVTSDPAECGKPGSTTYSCSLCGATFVETLPALEHEYDDNDWTPDAEKGYHTHNCINGCGTPEREECNYVETGRTEPQVGVPGEIQYTCTKCGDTKTTPIAAAMGLKLTASGAAYAGRTVSVKTELVGNPGLRSLTVSYGYDADIYTYVDYVGNVTVTGNDNVEWMVSGPSLPDADGYTWITINFSTTADAGFTGEEVLTVNFSVADEINASTSTIYAEVDAEGAVDTNNAFVTVPGAQVEIAVSDVLFGDFNMSGEVNLIDVVLMLRYTVGKTDVLDKVAAGEYSLTAFDANEDGNHTVDDVLIILKEVNDKLNNAAAGK